MEPLDAVKVGAVDDPQARVVRIVHISDTHMLHDEYVREGRIPHGDILIHSGDFANYRLARQFFGEDDYLSEIDALNTFFSGLPHRTKIFVAGNHETNFPRRRRERTTALLSSSCIYLEDSAVTIDGIKIYGSPWNGLRHNSSARSFVVPYGSLARHWQQIPDDVDVLVTHNPAYGVRDLGSNKHLFNVSRYCQLGQTTHRVFMHFGCRALLNDVLHTIRPKVHLFGHAHEPSGTEFIDGVLFSNAAMSFNRTANIIDYYINVEKQCSTDTQPEYYRQNKDALCTIL